jgi:hypothetical protein
VLLEAGERVLAQVSVNRASDDRAGLLTVTNHRIVLEVSQAQGLVSSLLSKAKLITVVNARWSAVTNAQASARLLGRPILHVSTHGGSLSVKTDQAAPPAPTYHGGAPVVVNVQAAPMYAPPPPPPPPAERVMMFTCSYCGRPSEASALRCPGCGRTFPMTR